MQKVVWLTVCGVFSAACVGVILTFLFVPEDAIHSVSRAISFPHRDCPLCGMTRAFCAISKGHFDQAVALNKGSVFLFTLFVAVPSCFIVGVLWRLKKKRDGLYVG